MMCKVSIIVPVFKVERYINTCVESLLNQTLKDIEIILVDDGSSDNCPVICDAYAKKDNRVKVIHKKNGGVSAARNDGLKQATGEFIIFCDSDDWLELTGIEALYNKAVEENADITIGNVYMVRKSGNKYVKFYKDEFVTSEPKFITELIKCDIYRTYCPCPAESGPAFGYGGPWNKLVKRELLTKNGIEFDLRVKGIFDDILYTASILACAKKIVYTQVPVYYYRIIEDSITHSYKPNIVEINDAIFHSWNEFFDNQSNSVVYQEAFFACVIRRLEEAIKLYFVNDKNKKSKKELKKELKELIDREPYYQAVRKVNISKISKKQKMLTYLGRFGLIGIIYTIKLF